jgi:uncharacterized protein involved in outer membrane biogenesis
VAQNGVMKNVKRWKTFAMLAAVCVVVLGAIAAGLVAANAGAIRPWVEREAASRAGVELRLQGPVSLRMSPHPSLRVADVHIQRDDGAAISARSISIEPALGALLSGRIQVRAVSLDRPEVSIAGAGGAGGGLAIPDTVSATLQRLGLERVEVTDATLTHRDAAGRNIRASDCNVSLRELRGTDAQLPAFAGEIGCGSLDIDDLSFGPLQADARSADGVLHLDPLSLQLLGSEMLGSVQADMNKAQPTFAAKLTLDDVSLRAFFDQVGAEASARGNINVRADVKLRGDDADTLLRSASGELSLRGRDIVLQGVDLDETIARFESSQSFHLVDVGAIFLAGPFGMLATQGYRFGSLVMTPQGESEIRALASDWTIKAGVAHARDVAFATERHRVAASGQVDFVNRRFDKLTIALLDDKGCARAEQALDGPFERAGEAGSGLVGLITGPTRNLFARGAALLSGGRCEPFYDGSVAAPR